MNTAMMSVYNLIVNPNNPRNLEAEREAERDAKDGETRFGQLVRSIGLDGVREPLTLVQLNKTIADMLPGDLPDSGLLVISGHRRLAACLAIVNDPEQPKSRRERAVNVPCIIKEFDKASEVIFASAAGNEGNVLPDTYSRAKGLRLYVQLEGAEKKQRVMASALDDTDKKTKCDEIDNKVDAVTLVSVRKVADKLSIKKSQASRLLIVARAPDSVGARFGVGGLSMMVVDSMNSAYNKLTKGGASPDEAWRAIDAALGGPLGGLSAQGVIAGLRRIGNGLPAIEDEDEKTKKQREEREAATAEMTDLGRQLADAIGIEGESLKAGSKTLTFHGENMAALFSWLLDVKMSKEQREAVTAALRLVTDGNLSIPKDAVKGLIARN